MAKGSFEEGMSTSSLCPFSREARFFLPELQSYAALIAAASHTVTWSPLYWPTAIFYQDSGNAKSSLRSRI